MIVSIPVILSEYFDASTGSDYKIGFFAKLRLARKMARNRRKIETRSHFLEHLVMATQILRVPKSVEGAVVECGTFKGGSAANLSLVCALCDRQLEIFDSFAGLPEPSTRDKEHVLLAPRQIHSYEQGALHGPLAEVQQNLSRWGAIHCCRFNVGYFEQTVCNFSRNCVLIFLDVDLLQSLETCLRHLWPRLQDGCYVFAHEVHHLEICALFFCESWWRSNLKCGAPGLIGAGTGLGLLPASGGFISALGYAVKNAAIGNFEVRPETGVIG